MTDDPGSRLEPRPLHGVDELPEVQRLYDLAGWGPISLESLERMFFTGSNGPALIMVLANAETDQIMGMTAFTPHRVQIGDAQEVASRARSAILDPSLRRSTTGRVVVDDQDPLRRITQASLPFRLARGWRISYALPNPLFRERNQSRTPEVSATRSTVDLGYGLRFKLSESTRSVDTIVPVSADTPAGPEYDDLWERARRNLNIRNAVVRDAQGQRGLTTHIRLELRNPRTGTLRGYMRLKPDKVGRLEDLLAEDHGTFDELIDSSLAWLEANRSQHTMRKLVSLPHPIFAESLQRSGAIENDYFFTFFVRSLDGVVGQHSDAANWYVTMGD